MTGLTSPDAPAYLCYAIVLVFGGVVARSTVNRLLDGYPDHWAFASTWALFFAHAALPVALFWFLDYTSALHDTSLFAALVVSVAYRQIFAAGVQGISMPGQTSALWKPFEAWVATVADRIGTKQKLYLDHFDDKVRSLIASDPDRMVRFETLVLSNSRDVAALQTALQGLAKTGNQEADERRKLDLLWRDLRTSQPRDYGWLLHGRKIVRRWRYWMWLSNGRAKLISAASICLGLLLAIGLYLWSSGGDGTLTRRQAGLVRYHQWRFVKANSTERDQWRSQQFLYGELCRSGSESIPVQALLGPLVREIRFPSVGDRQARSVLALIVTCHSPRVDANAVPELIESLRTASEAVRLHIRNALIDILRADYPNAPVLESLTQWEPKKDESAGDLDKRVRDLLRWWQNAAKAPGREARTVERGQDGTGEHAAIGHDPRIGALQDAGVEAVAASFRPARERSRSRF